MNKTFQKNIEALDKILMPEYIDLIKEATTPAWATPIKSEDGTSNLLITHGVEKQSLYRMGGWSEEIKKRLEDAEFNSSAATMIIGLGLGFHLHAALEIADDKHKFLVVEPDAGILKLALSECDFSEYILDKKIILAPTVDDVAFSVEFMNEKYVVDDWMIFIEGYTIKNPIYAEISFASINLLNQVRCNIGTISSAGKQIADNDIANLPYTIHRRGVSELEGLYKGHPAILVSTGPSLRKNIHYLIKNKNKAIIIACGQALRPLLSYGITPDFICSVDFGEVNLTHYEGLMETGVPLVALNQSYAELLKRWKGPVFVTTSVFVSTLPAHDDRVHKLLSNKGSLLQGGSVAHMCFGLGVHLGCDPLIMIGQDLAYEDEQSHFPQADSRGILKTDTDGTMQWEVQDPRCHLHGKEYSMGAPIEVEGYFMKAVKTNVGLSSFITSFERFTKTLPDLEVINATEGGCHIPGTIRMSLSKALKEYCQESITDKKEKLEPLLSECEEAVPLIKKCVPLLQNEIEILNKIIFNGGKALGANKKLLPYLNGKRWTEKKKIRFLTILSKNTKHSLRAHEESKLMPIVSLSIYGADRKIRGHALNVKVKDSLEEIDGKENQENLKIGIEKNLIILTAAVDASKSLKKTYKEVLAILRNAALKNDPKYLFSTKPEPDPDIHDAEKYFEVGNFARPMLEAGRIIDLEETETFNSNDYAIAQNVYWRAIRMRDKAVEEAEKSADQTDYIDSIQLICDAQKIGREEKKFDTAKEMLEKAHDLQPNIDVVQWGLASVYFHTKEYDKSLEMYKKLVSNNDDEPRYLFEMGQVQIYAGKTYEGITSILSAMDQTHAFDSFFAVLGDTLCGMSDFNEGIINYEKYLEKFPADYEVWVKLSQTYKKLGRSNKEAEALQKANAIKGEEI
ncbi:MAG TPA: 6-hydroxymethylpterin diphosphokinase MptE-like protein [Alphaproteobacteria bacterium]|nr:6-hydroxymethylpterin diphosphokinase MptE-like protein [Alphaproteobacteria bacterium]